MRYSWIWWERKMRKILTVAIREFVETVKTKTFLFSLIVPPLIVIILGLVMGRAARRMETGPRPPKRIVAMDLSREVYAGVMDLCKEYNLKHGDRQIRIEPYGPENKDVEAFSRNMRRQVAERNLDAYLLIPKGVIDGGEKPQCYLRTDSIADLSTIDTVQRFVNDAVRRQRCVRHNLAPELIDSISEWVPIERQDARDEGAGSRGKNGADLPARMMAPFFFMFLMFMGVFGVNQQGIVNVIEEKSNRVMELLLSTVSPYQLMAGKILGLSAIGLVAVAVWGAVAGGMAVHQGLAAVISPVAAICFPIYYILGFVLFAAIFTAAGSACNTPREAQSLMMPVTLTLMAPMIGWFYFAQHPEGFWATALSFVPPMTPLVMTLRLGARPDLPLVQVFLSIAVLAASLPVVIWAAAKVFRTGVLMYGKPPTPRELIRWLRHK